MQRLLVVCLCVGCGAENSAFESADEAPVDVAAEAASDALVRGSFGPTVTPISVRLYRHGGGIKADTAASASSNVDAYGLVLADTELNVDVTGIGSATVVSLQRLGDYRARIWNDFLTTTSGGERVFNATQYLVPKSRVATTSVFLMQPSGDAEGNDPNRQFVEQHVYLWAQRLKTHVDQWGRDASAKGVTSVSYYPPHTDRGGNIEIMVNADPTTFCASGAMHGCVMDAPSDATFNGVATPDKMVAFVHRVEGDGQPEHVGPEVAPSYSVIAHEIGHWISWSYGGWGVGNEGGSVNEGLSMAIAAMFGKSFWGSRLSYQESEEVTTGSKRTVNGVERQWQYATATEFSVYNSASMCGDTDNANEDDNVNRYYLAWPWVEAMWELMNNVDASTGRAIWATADDAVANVEDFLMNILYNKTVYAQSSNAVVNSDPRWDDISQQMLTRMARRIGQGKEKGLLVASYARVSGVLERHGLLACDYR